MKTNDQRSRKFHGPVVVLLFLVTTATLAMPSTPMLASPPDPITPRPEPFYIRLEQPLVGPGTPAKPLSAPVQIAANPGEWYDLDLVEGFEDTFPPENWQIINDSGWQRWDGEPRIGSASAGITDTTTMADSWLVYGPTDELATYDIANARLRFSYWLDSEQDVGWFGWAASSDGQAFYGARVSGSVRQWLTGELDMAQYLSEEMVWVAFFFLGGGPGNSVYVDDVTLQGVEPYKVYLPNSMKNYERPLSDFHDDFDDPSSGWPIEHVNNLPEYEAHRYYSNQYGTTYRMRLGGLDWFTRLSAFSERAQTGDEFTLQVDIMYDLDDYRAEFGLVFETNDSMTSYYMVTLLRYGPYMWYKIRRRTPAEGSVELVPSLPAPDYMMRDEGEWNTIRIVRKGNSIRFYTRHPWGHWNLIQSTSSAPPLSGDRVAFTIYHAEVGANAWFDNFHLWQTALYP